MRIELCFKPRRSELFPTGQPLQQGLEVFLRRLEKRSLRRKSRDVEAVNGSVIQARRQLRLRILTMRTLRSGSWQDTVRRVGRFSTSTDVTYIAHLHPQTTNTDLQTQALLFPGHFPFSTSPAATSCVSIPISPGAISTRCSFPARRITSSRSLADLPALRWRRPNNSPWETGSPS